MIIIHCDQHYTKLLTFTPSLSHHRSLSRRALWSCQAMHCGVCPCAMGSMALKYDTRVDTMLRRHMLVLTVVDFIFVLARGCIF
eukprot:6173817-Pleurochrysis_carterae.AAC.3